MQLQTPDWVKDAVFYQIFPDRFARSDRTEHPPGLEFKPWGSPPEEQGYQGGDLRGVVDRLDYLQNLGITAIYLNPIFSSASNHRYHTYDYFAVDPLLGGDDALRELLDAAHARDMRVVLDGVFNHTGRGFWPFHHILENGEDSPYIDWFIIKDWPLRPYNHDEDNPHNYAAWWDLPALPKLNTAAPAVRDYIYEAARYWLDFGIDGWRLDVPEEIDDDEFWRGFRRVCKGANPDAYICGEIWRPAHRWLQGDMFDGVMNYIFAWSVLTYVGKDTIRDDIHLPDYNLTPRNARAFQDAIDRMHSLYDKEVTYAQLNLLDSHDTPRALWMFRDDESALRLAVLLQMTFPGAPCIYYGDEIGLSAGNDPHCRGVFPWEQEDSWNHDLLSFYRKAVAMRHTHPVLRRGTFESLYAEDMVYVCRRQLDDVEALVVLNAGQEPSTFTLEGASKPTYADVWRDDSPVSVEREGLTLTVPPRDAAVLVGR